MAKTEYFAQPGIRVLAHRGLWQHRTDIAENSLAAFSEALSHGATHLESDVHATGDGHAVLFHDDDLSRIAGLPVKIKDLSLSELKRIEIGSGESVPTLAEAFEAFPTAKFNLDIKADGAIAASARVIEQAKAHARVLVSSFSERRRSATLGELREPVATSASGSLALATFAAHRVGLTGYLRKLATRIDALQVPPRQSGVVFENPRLVAALQELGIEVHFWTINDPSEMQRLVGLGARGIVSDRVDLAVKVL